MHTLIEILVYGSLEGALIAVGASGFSLQFGVTNVLNLAYGATMTSAIFVAYWVGSESHSIWSTIVITAIWGALFQLLISELIVNPYVKRGAGLFAMAMVTFGLGIVLQFTLQAIQGPTVLSFAQGSNHVYRLGYLSVSFLQIATAVVAVMLMASVYLLLRATRLGLAIRATAASPELARSSGISTRRTRAVAWSVSGLLCGIAGGLLGLNQGSFDSVTGNDFFITVVAAAALGGMGSAYGAMAGAVGIALVSEASAALISPSYKYIVAFAVLIAVLLVRPQGLFGRETSRKVIAS